MNLKPKANKEIREIIQRDYRVFLSDEEADRLGFLLLKITQRAMAVFNRDNNLSIKK